MKTLLVWIVRAYQIALSPMLGQRCRFYPSCSHYAIEALTTYGAVRGLVLALWRIARCNPWGGHGYDPPRWFGEAPVLRVGEAPDDGARNATSGERV